MNTKLAGGCVGFFIILIVFLALFASINAYDRYMEPAPIPIVKPAENLVVSPPIKEEEPEPEVIVKDLFPEFRKELENKKSIGTNKISTEPILIYAGDGGQENVPPRGRAKVPVPNAGKKSGPVLCYITPSGGCYHRLSSCGGINSLPVYSVADVRGKSFCGKCWEGPPLK